MIGSSVFNFEAGRLGLMLILEFGVKRGDNPAGVGIILKTGFVDEQDPY